MSWKPAVSCSRAASRRCGTTPTSASSTWASTRSARASPTATSSTTSAASAGCPESCYSRVGRPLTDGSRANGPLVGRVAAAPNDGGRRMLSVLDRHLKLWHVVLANAAALAWFGGMQLATLSGIPGVKFFRCPIGLCLGDYSPGELNATLARIGRSGRQFLAETLLPLDMVLPALVLLALALTYVWFSRPHQPTAIPLSSGARYAFLCVPLFYCLADYAENWTLAEVLQAYPNIPYRLARRASFLTAAKSQLVVAAVGIAAALVIAAWAAARRSGEGNRNVHGNG